MRCFKPRVLDKFLQIDSLRFDIPESRVGLGAMAVCVFGVKLFVVEWNR